jgi:hypothetical protein
MNVLGNDQINALGIDLMNALGIDLMNALVTHHLSSLRFQIHFVFNKQLK